MEKEKIHINKVKNTADIKTMTTCCNVELNISGGGYDGEEIVSILERCPKCGESNPKTYNLDSGSGKRISYQGVKVPF